jgi:hypothetical protein
MRGIVDGTMGLGCGQVYENPTINAQVRYADTCGLRQTKKGYPKASINATAAAPCCGNWRIAENDPVFADSIQHQPLRATSRAVHTIRRTLAIFARGLSLGRSYQGGIVWN